MKQKKRLNTKQFVQELKYRLNKREDFGTLIYEYQLEIILDVIKEIFIDVLSSGLMLVIRGFGTLYADETNDRNLYDINTGKIKKIKGRKLPKFRFSEQIKKIIK